MDSPAEASHAMTRVVSNTGPLLHLAKAALDRLAQSSLWVSAGVLAEAKAALQRLSQ